MFVKLELICFDLLDFSLYRYKSL